ncbi:MAG TPA: hypothetical protein VG755_15720 [Nannocystaceae bacterium]|nr:hypothetical protein [Nannocystaceae bacterium]
MPGPRSFVVMLFLGIATACSGDQQGYYDACAEPAGLALGCDAPSDDELTSWDACMKLAKCGVILFPDDPMNPDDPKIFDRCIDQIEESFDDIGDTVLACIDESQCPELAKIEPVDNDDPDASANEVEGIIGWCGRLDPE